MKASAILCDDLMDLLDFLQLLYLWHSKAFSSLFHFFFLICVKQWQYIYVFLCIFVINKNNGENLKKHDTRACWGAEVVDPL